MCFLGSLLVSSSGGVHTGEREVLVRSEDVCVFWSKVAGFWFLFGLLHLSAKEGGGRLLMARPLKEAHAGPAWVQRTCRSEGRQV